MEDRMTQLLADIEKLQKEKAELQWANAPFSIDTIKDSDIPFYTGFPSRAVFDKVFAYFNPDPNGENLILNSSDSKGVSATGTKTGRPRKPTPQNQFFLFLCRVRVGLMEQYLANRFGVSVSTVSNLVISWANYIYLKLGVLNIWPSKQQIKSNMPSSFKEKYPSTRIIIDCTEIKTQMSSSLLSKSMTYSNYKSSNTLKGLIGITPGGCVSFVSQLYTGCISDQEITRRSGLLKMDFDDGDSIMADKGFEIQDLLDQMPVCVKLNIPPKLGLYGQMALLDVRDTQSIAAERIHVERAINKIKNFHIFDQVIPISLSGSINQIWTTCAVLTLFHNPIISCPIADSVLN
ncbi:PREDICTED: uncharacterized protein LOC106815336 [Priapulus caudatus]|uniref:Uncharacterized protein LOC106815336 n=1 Tax=Priapulus caudatus TaxID=37621 RepID=A0ABM1ESU6_PRICU|nr:PREDICTED: uncharacterized protein LOC106815336 [Priapulus caudatus]